MEATLKGGGKPNKLAVLGGYALVMVLCAAFYVNETSIAGTLAGAVFGGMAFGMRGKLIWNRQWFEGAFQAVMMFTAAAVYGWRQSIAPPTWEPTAFQEIAGFAAFFVVYVLVDCGSAA